MPSLPTVLATTALLLAGSSAALGDNVSPTPVEDSEIPATTLLRFTRGTPIVDKDEDFIEDRFQGPAHQIMLFAPRHSAQRFRYGSPLRPHFYLVHPPPSAGDSIPIVFKCREAATMTIRLRMLDRDHAVQLVRLTPTTGAVVLPPQSKNASPIHLLIETGSGRWEAFVHLKSRRPRAAK